MKKVQLEANLNDLANKLDTLKETCTKSPIDILCFETKLGSSFLGY